MSDETEIQKVLDKWAKGVEILNPYFELCATKDYAGLNKAGDCGHCHYELKRECKRGEIITKQGEQKDLAALAFAAGKQAGKKELVGEIWGALYDVYSGKADWSCQCPPERRGALIALVHLLGFSWEEANKMTFETENWEKLKSQLEPKGSSAFAEGKTKLGSEVKKK